MYAVPEVCEPCVDIAICDDERCLSAMREQFEVYVSLIDREQDVLGTIHCGSGELAGQIGKHGAVAKFRWWEKSGLERCSRELERLVMT